VDSSSAEAPIESVAASAGQLEIAHMLFIAVVGYSKLLANEPPEKL